MKRDEILTLFDSPLEVTSNLYYASRLDNREIPETIALLPMAEFNAFPQLISNIIVEETNCRLSVSKSLATDHYLGLFALKSLDVDTADFRPEDFYPIGVAAQILRVSHENTQSGPIKVTVQGLCRISLTDVVHFDSSAGPAAKVAKIVQNYAPDESLTPLILEAKRLFSEDLKLIPGLPADVFKLNSLLEERPDILADLIISCIPLKPEFKAEYLLIDDLRCRYYKLLEFLTLDISTRKVGRAISERIEHNLEQRQREFHLREQLKAIKAELGEEEGYTEHSHLSEKLETLNLPKNIRLVAEIELRRLRFSPSHSLERGAISDYLDWIFELPWTKASVSSSNLAKARQIIDRNHFGLTAVKKRILEYLAVYKLTESHKPPVLCLLGPPGVGKTSLAKSVAKALERKFIRISLGGLKDEAEIKGHRRAYVGAKPGKIITGLRKAGVKNPVFLLDEIDKMSRGLNGDPGSALLEALDSEQNDSFTDNFLELPFDLSGVFFIVTANVLENIAPALRDRLEIIEVNGYSFDEKMAIAKKHLWPKELFRHGLNPKDVEVTDECLAEIICSYTWEAGCRELGRKLGALARSRAVAKAEGLEVLSPINQDELVKILGPPKHISELRERKGRTGVVTGLAWTAAGGDIMFVEAVAMPGNGRISLTGQLGEVMKESAQAAISYVRSHYRDWLLDDRWFQEHDLHIHLPHGAIPKDGPSAGISLAAAVVSLISGQKVRPDVAMTGEISLRGLVLAVGGLKEKLLAAKRAGLAAVIVPSRNQMDLILLDQSVTQGLEVVTVDSLEQALEYCLMKPETNLDTSALGSSADNYAQREHQAAVMAGDCNI
ncbi:MAG: endopeptidase La [Deltaproteobacteria bacterium]|jgi:ATP-dependent Lon protease|nr:endopeptidase La [Deltaproteobacteria bacterium]